MLKCNPEIIVHVPNFIYIISDFYISPLGIATDLKESLCRNLGQSNQAGMDATYKFLNDLFTHLDVNKNDSLSLIEVKTFFKGLGIDYSRKRWARLFCIMDTNANNDISREELIGFILPESKKVTVTDSD